MVSSSGASNSHYVVRAQRPEFFNDLHAHFFGLGDRGFASFDGVLDVADALIGKLNKTDIPSHFVCSFREVFLKGYCGSACVQSNTDLREPGADPQRFRFQLFRMALSSSNFSVSVLKLVRYQESIGNTNGNALRRSVNLFVDMDCAHFRAER